MLPELATELLTKIFLELHVGDLTRCKRVCRRLNDLVTNDLSLQYKIELDIAGMVDGPPGGADLGVRLKKLHARNATWQKGPPMHTLLLDSPNIPTTVWHCTGGFLLYEQRSTAQSLQLQLHRPAYPNSQTSGGLKVASKTLFAWKTSIPSLTEIRSCSVNPEENMVVITKDTGHMEIPRCVVLSISRDTTPHPMAAQSEYLASRPRLQPGPRDRDRIESVGDLISWTIHPGMNTGEDSEMLVINWKSGTTVWRSEGKSTAKSLLLDPSHVLVIDHEGLFVHEFDPNSTPQTTPRCSTTDDSLISFALPSLHGGTRVETLQCYVPGPRNFRGDRVHFQEDPDLAVLAIHMCTSTSRRFHQPPHKEHLIYVVPLSTILAELENHARIPIRRGGTVIPWPQWGPDGARLLRVDSEPHILTIMGSRVAIPLGARNLEIAQDIFIIDVRPRSAEETFSGRGGNGSAALGAPRGRVDVSDTIPGLKTFVDPVTTRLPYRMTYVKAWTESDAKLVVGQVLTHDGIVLTCNPLPLPIGQVMQQMHA
ncbi:hypothetical protein K466DRAFT_602699 [Polyporus arcularius HHB13444]|uniref:F-box domain-containing protein n=1 Tax=Polyporus arcularius HHB13444 TaxID=1314778 RepID=A0A5C3P1W6_9APHY|nr:hypothetical protein K466DRAFT_602699 [Polyporus arcularius HHB13444]